MANARDLQCFDLLLRKFDDEAFFRRDHSENFTIDLESGRAEPFLPDEPTVTPRSSTSIAAMVANFRRVSKNMPDAELIMTGSF